jgi:quercetin dioxygenase-like cupin family protein
MSPVYGHNHDDLIENGPHHDLTPTALYRKRQELLEEIGFLELEFDRRRAEKRLLVKEADLTWFMTNELTPTAAEIKFCPIISPEQGFDIYNFHMFMLEVPPHGDPAKAAYHRHGDAIKYYLSGRALERIGDETFEVEAGDFIHIPANAWHGTVNPYDEPVKILAVQQFPGTYSQYSAPFIDRTRA